MSTTPVTDEGAFTFNTKAIVNAGIGDCVTPTTTFNVVSSTTLTDITGMTTTLGVGTYVIDAQFSGTANAAGGWKIGLNYTNGLTLSAADLTGVAFTASSTVFPNRMSSTTAQTAIISSTSAVTAGQIFGIVTVSAPGTMAFQFAQNASNAASSTIYAGSVAYIRKLI